MGPHFRTKRFRVGLTADFFDAQSKPKYPDLGLSVLDAEKHIEYSALEGFESRVTADQTANYQGLIVLTPAITEQSVSRAENLLAVGRFGVGYDAVDVAACTAADVAVFITAGAVDRSVAEATVGWMLALTHRMRAKDLLVRTARWDERSQFMGCELRDRTFGTIGLGGIARATVGLLRGFGMKQPLAFDPYVSRAEARNLRVRLVELDELLAESDFVSIHCPLTPATKGMIGAKELAKMKPDAYLINTARGGIVDEEALTDAIANGRIAGAALDCFATEPLREPHPLSEYDNVLMAPHSIAWTAELFRDIGRMVCQGMVDLANGRRPHGVVNPEVFDRPSFQAKWARLTAPDLQTVFS